MKLKRLLLLAGAALLILPSARSQSVRSVYFLRNHPMRHLMNPALQPEGGFIAPPVLGAFTAEVNTNSFYVDHFLYKRPDGDLTTFLDPSVDARAFIGRLKENNRLNQDLLVNLFGMGLKREAGYWSFGVNFREALHLTVPKGFFELAKLGPDHYSPITRYKLFADSYLESYVGLSKRLGDRLTLGAKVKLMVGLGSAGMTVDRFEVVSGEEVLMADVKTRLDLHARGLRQNVKEKVDFEAYWDGLSYDWRNAGLAGAGVAVDLGAEFRLTDRMRLSAALTDIGFMGWTKRSAVRGESDGLVEFTGLEIDIDDDDSVNDQLDDLKDRFLTMLQYQEVAGRSVTRALYAKFNIGAEMSFLDDLLSAGVLYSGQLSRYYPVNELTLNGAIRPLSWLEGALSASMLNGQFRSAGFALNLAAPRVINFTLGADYIFTRHTKQFYPVHSGGTNIYAGIVVPL